MAVRVKIEVRFKEKSKFFVALVNTGYESRTAQLLLPEIPEIKNFLKNMKFRKRRFLTAGGETQFYVSDKKVKVRVVTGDRKGRWADSQVVLGQQEEPLLNDMLTEKLRIVILKPSSGIWRFDDENVERESEKG